MSTFTWSPQYGAKATTQPRVLSAKYGDGYEQRVAYGINFQFDTWALSFAAESDTISAIDSFLAAQGGVTSFDWITPEGVTGAKWVCRSWQRGPVDGDAWQLQATFEQVFGE